MSRNNLKRFPTAILRRGMAHIHPVAWPAGRTPTARADWMVETIVPTGPAQAVPHLTETPSAEHWPA